MRRSWRGRVGGRRWRSIGGVGWIGLGRGVLLRDREKGMSWLCVSGCRDWRCILMMDDYQQDSWEEEVAKVMAPCWPYLLHCPNDTSNDIIATFTFPLLVSLCSVCKISKGSR